MCIESITKRCRHTVILLICGLLASSSLGQSVSTGNKHSMRVNSPSNPKLQGFLVRLHGDNGVSIIDTDGKVISRNFIPANNSQGKVSCGSYSTPVLNGIFCIKRTKRISDSNWKSTTTIYKNPSNPKPVPGLTDLYSANIINPDLFPICRYGERIKFVDNNGNVKFTVMPIDGKEPRSVHPFIANGLIDVEVMYDVITNDYTDSNGLKHKGITKSTTKCGAIDTNGRWVIYPEWDRIEFTDDGKTIGWKGKEIYRFDANYKPIRDTRFENFYNIHNWPINGKYLIEQFVENDTMRSSNIYNLDGSYITTISDADYIRVNHANNGILNVRRGFYSGHKSYDNLVDITQNNRVISRNYKNLLELPNGNYLGVEPIDNETDKCWYVSAEGNAIPLPGNTKFPLNHPLMAFYYNTDIHYFIANFEKSDPAYLCDFNGNRIGNISLDEYYNREWENEPVKSSYWRIHIYGVDD